MQIVEEPEVKFYWWLLATSHLNLIIYALAVKRGDDFFYMEDHCMVRKCVSDSNADC